MTSAAGRPTAREGAGHPATPRRKRGRAGSSARDAGTAQVMLDTTAPDDPFAAVLGTDRPRADLGMRRWPLGVRRVVHGAGPLRVPAITENTVIHQLAGSAAVDCRLDGRWASGAARAGLVTVLPAGVARDWRFGGAIEALHLYIHPATLAEVAEEVYPAAGQRPRLSTSLGVGDDGIGRIAASVLDELAPGEGALLGRLHADLLAQALAVQLLRRHAPMGVRPAAPANTAVGSARLRRALDHAEAHLAEDVSLADLAAAAGLSPWHFARAFRAAVGTSPHAHLQGRRVKRAEGLLARTELPLAHVALACGFKGQSHSGQVFRHAVGVTPGRFRAVARR